MNNNAWFKKQRPFMGFGGFGGGGLGLALGGGGDATIEASGGLIGEYTDAPGDNIYRTHTFVSPGFLQVSQVVGDGEIEYLVVAGGGGGGMTSHNYSYPHGIEEISGGGGGGGVRTNLPGLPTSASNPLNVSTSGGPTSNGKYPITIGRGAPTGSTQGGGGGNGFKGLDSTFNYSPTAYITSSGGGGASGEGAGTQRMTGGSGGGGNIDQPTVSPTPQTTASGAAGNTPPSSPAQGFDGGDASAQSRGGGGGGAIEVGAPGATTGKGGDGLGTTIENGNITVYYGGGGGGGGQYAPPINGGAAGPLDPTVPTTGYYPSIPGKGTGTGGRGNIPWGGSYPGMARYQYQTSGAGGISGYGQGGGGASVFGSGSPGGDGCVVIRYKIAEQTGTAKATGGIINYYPESPLSPTGAVIHIFRGPGRFNTPPTFNETMEYVVLGGGGAGGAKAAAGGGGAGGYVTGTTPLSTAAFINVFVGMGGNGRDPGYNWGGTEVIGTNFVSAGQGFGCNSVVEFPTGTVTAGGGAYGIGKFRKPTSIDPSPPTGAPSEGYAGNAPLGSGGGGGSSPVRPPGTGGPQGNDGGGGTYQIGGGGGGAGAAGGNGVATPTLYRGGYGGAGVQLPATFRNPTMLTPSTEIHTGGGLGYPGPGGGGFWVAGGGGGGTTVGSWGDHTSAGGAYGVYGGGPGASSVTSKSQWGPSHKWFGWCGAGSGRGVGMVAQLPNGTYGPTSPGTNKPATSGYGGSAASNSGSGGGAGAQEPKFAPPPGVPYTSSFPSGGDGGPGIVLIAYPQ